MAALPGKFYVAVSTSLTVMLKALLCDSNHGQWFEYYQKNIHINARAVSELLRSSDPTDVVVTRVGEILRQSIYIGRLANRDRVLLHIPRILLSASAEFEEARASNKQPQLDRISADDERIKSSPWYRAEGRILPPQRSLTVIRIPPRPHHHIAPSAVAESDCSTCQQLHIPCTRSNPSACDQCHKSHVHCSLVPSSVIINVGPQHTQTEHNDAINRNPPRLGEDELTRWIASIENRLAALEKTLGSMRTEVKTATHGTSLSEDIIRR
ncbi:hypothetical protein PILCRDRAFT_545502 [Piloderma croceum F 1598]|uniref:Zn(2)-C6 fungal-type domain-containing protein n=1 Tax=Piloderma croceum (strain F 1598) TaxID=765440 RepID=A0A0C3BR61_PILCF|nr:hypothetical protein PILCRDRAFT_545502 [Piloderma croceum F 1598]